MVCRVSSTEARNHFGALMQQAVGSNEPIIVERRGKAHVAVLSIQTYERLLRGQQPQADWQELVRQARAQIQADLGRRTLPAPQEILAELRAERDEHFPPERFCPGGTA